MTYMNDPQIILCSSRPSTHPYISDAEKSYLEMHLKESTSAEDAGGTPWKSIVTSRPVIAMVFLFVSICFHDVYEELLHDFPSSTNVSC